MAHYSIAVIVPPPALEPGDRIDDDARLHDALGPILEPLRHDESEVPEFEGECA